MRRIYVLEIVSLLGGFWVLASRQNSRCTFRPYSTRIAYKSHQAPRPQRLPSYEWSPPSRLEYDEIVINCFILSAFDHIE